MGEMVGQEAETIIAEGTHGLTLEEGVPQLLCVNSAPAPTNTDVSFALPGNNNAVHVEK